MYIDQAARIFRLFLLFFILALSVGCGDEGGDGDEAGEESSKSNVKKQHQTFAQTKVL